MTESVALLIAEAVIIANDPEISQEEFNEFLNSCPDAVKEAYDIITADRLNQTLQVIL